MGTNTGTVMTIANSIIGVSVLAMPFCFKECGILLSIVMLFLSSVLSRLTCFLVLKAAVMSRRRNFEFLAFHVFGTTGKFLVELCIIGFLMGTCIAFFVVVGDLGPAILAKTLSIANSDSLRSSVLIGLALLVVLPLGLLRNVDSLSSICTASIGFYVCLVLKVVAEALPHLRSGEWLEKVEYWRPEGMLQCLPIFSMALFCQTQLFEIYETMPNASLERMNGAVRSAINICTCVYISVGLFGYIAFCTESFSGNILMSFSPSLMSDIIKIGFVLSVAVSFPLVIFPCRASLYSLLFRRVQVPHHEVASSYIPEARFKCITLFIVSVSLVIGLIIPNIELVLGLVGSTIGVGICVIFPALAFIFVSTKENTERIVAQILFFVGILILILGTYATLVANSETHKPVKVVVNQEFEKKVVLPDIDKSIQQESKLIPLNVVPKDIVKEVPRPPPLVPINVVSEASVVKNVGNDKDAIEVRKEPPVPIEPVDKAVKETNDVKIKESKELPLVEEKSKELPVVEKQVEESVTVKRKDESKDKINNEQVINKDAIKKEDEELEEAEKQSKEDTEKKNKQLLLKLEKHKEEQHKLLEEQRQILQELKEQKKEADKEKEENNVLAAVVPQSNLKENEQLPIKKEEPTIQNKDVPKEPKYNLDAPKLPKFGYASSKNQADKLLPPKQPIAYEQRFSNQGDRLKHNEEPLQHVEKAQSAESLTNQKIEKPQNPSIKTLLLPPGPIIPSIPSNLKVQENIAKNNAVDQGKVLAEEHIVNNAKSAVGNNQNNEIEKVRNLEILKANAEVNEAKAMRRDILGTGGGNLKETNENHDREKRDALMQESQVMGKLQVPSIVSEVIEQNELNNIENLGNCKTNKELQIENKNASDTSQEAVKKVMSSGHTLVKEPVASESAAIKTSLLLSDPEVQSLGDSKLLNTLQKELVENGVKPMPRDLKSINSELMDVPNKNSNHEADSKK